MRYARNVGLALLGLLVLAFGVRAIARIVNAESADGSGFSGPHTSISIAKLSSGNALDNCADVTFAGKKEFDDKRLAARGFVLLKSTCAKSFPNSVALASCSRSDVDVDAQPSIQAVGYYYDLATFEGDDTYRGQCLGNGGSWVVKPPNDPDLARARARLVPSKPHHEFDSLMELAP
jgi:hypothetical protein